MKMSANLCSEPRESQSKPRRFLAQTTSENFICFKKWVGVTTRPYFFWGGGSVTKGLKYDGKQIWSGLSLQEIFSRILVPCRYKNSIDEERKRKTSYSHDIENRLMR